MTRQLRLSLERQGLSPRDIFARGPSNADAVDALAAWPGWIGGCLVLVGPQGAGKSHLAQMWAERAGALVVQRGKSDIAAAQGRPVLLEDADRGLADEALFHLINLAEREGGGLLLTARILPATWRTTLPDLRSRLNALPVAQIEAPDDTVLRGVLAKLFRDRNIRPAEDLYGYLLSRMGRSVPEAEDIVRRLDEAGDGGFRPVTRVLARQILEQDPKLDL